MNSPDARQTPGGWATRIARAPWRLIGIALLVLVLLNTDLHAIVDRFSRLGLGFVAGAAAAFAVLLAIRCWRWRVLTIAVGARQPFWQQASSFNHSVWLGMATPGRIGEFRRAADLAVVQRWGMAAASGLVLLDLLIDLGAYGAIGVGGYLWLIDSSRGGSLAAAAIVSFAALSVIGCGSLVRLLMRFVPRISKVAGLSELLPALRDGLTFGVGLKLVTTTMLASLAYVCMVWCLVHPMQPDLSGGYIGTAVGLAGIAGAVPVTYFGLGTRDIVMIWFFGQIHKLPSDAVAFSFSILLAQLIGIFVSLAAIPLLRAAATRERRENGGSSWLQLQRRRPG